MSSLVSIIINCFNQGHYLERSVKSVISQTYNNIECLIVDDGSTDNTRLVSEELTGIYPQVKYFFKENSGLPSSRNFGVRQAQGEWIQCLDADDWIHEDKIRLQLSYLAEVTDHDSVVLYADYERVYIDAQENIVNRQENIIGALATEQLIQRLLIPDFLTNSPHPCLQQAMLIHKNVLSKTQFPEYFKALGDRYFAVDILKAGANFVYTPMIGAYYTKHQSNRTNNWNYMRNYYVLFYETIAKNYPELNQFCRVGIEHLLEEAIREQDEDTFNRLIKIVTPPINLFDKKFKVNNKLTIQILNKIRQITPSFLLYEKYRGPRSKKIISLFTEKMKLLKG
ncbi:glycosyltransferase family 2 protein [Nostoc sp. TCL26-01]|uniref:glycosyltransferase family 2 protein n=1 Tax=Nostoc sp. TCL26-01 TaxID=2576904 RepID=UPI0015C10064|nr:glycosyltransferase family 2 protein [Nostoc sp. TCL26-01]QLE56567.1 glycosyltransferase family 2 protein [Nostoc sp. TCL26-01]